MSMVMNSLKWYWVQLVRSKSDSYITLQVQANNQSEAEIFATRQMAIHENKMIRNYWVPHDSGEITGCPYMPHEEYNGVIFWEEEEDSTENNRKFFVVLFPGKKNTQYIRNISRREDLFAYINNVIWGPEECIL